MKKIFLTKRLSFVLFLLAAFVTQSFAAEATYKVTNPHELANKQVLIETEWDFYWCKKVTELKTEIKPDLKVTVPLEWNKYNLEGEAGQVAKTGKGAGTYRLIITNLIPNTNYAFPVYEFGYTAFNIYANGKLIFSSGTPELKWAKTQAEQYSDKAIFTADSKGSVVIAVFISNDFYRKGGFRGAFKLSEEKTYNQIHIKDICFYGLFAGILLMIVLYCFTTALLKKDKTNLYLAILTIAIFARIISTIFPLLKELFPGVPFTVMLRIEYVSLFIIPAMHTLYYDSLNKKIFGKYKAKIIAAPAAVFLILNIFLPISVLNKLVPLFQVYMFSLAVIDNYFAIVCLVKSRDFISLSAIISFVFLGFGAAVTELSILHIITINDGLILTITLFIYVLCQIILLAYIQNKNYMTVIQLNKNLVETNKAYFRFVPKEFLKLLSKKNITEVTLGEHKVAPMGILSADIRNFTSTSEKMEPIQVFDMLNTYLGKIAPLIRENNGIIEKYLGDGIIAIFPDSAISAINCAVQMQEKMLELREEFQKKNMPLIKIGIGIHYGNVVFGTCGGNERMTEVSLSDDIDITIKTEAATKTVSRSILVTEQALKFAAAEVKAVGQKFSFEGEELDPLKTPELPKLFSVYNDKFDKSL
ncbi:MAG: adenylate/guanylate cyclase domain-containing protein [Treponema sp.]|nr:adenylate/guanylate cyclase domain-containing protein [Treponema sp.]